jgi:ATP-dependent DNA helicase RecG
VFLIDKVQKGGRLTSGEVAILRKKKLIEGRSPNLFLAANVAESIDEKAQYIRNIVHNVDYLKTMIVEHLKAYGSGKKSDFMKLVLPELPKTLNDKQKEIQLKIF